MKPTHAEKCLAASIYYFPEPENMLYPSGYKIKCMSCNIDSDLWAYLLNYCYILKVPACNSCRQHESILSYFIRRIIPSSYNYTRVSPFDHAFVTIKYLHQEIKFELSLEEPIHIICYKNKIKYMIPLNDLDETNKIVLGILNG